MRGPAKHCCSLAPSCWSLHIPSFNALMCYVFLGFFSPQTYPHPSQCFNFWNFLPCECLISPWQSHAGSGVHG